MHLFILQNQVLNVLPEDTFTYQTYNLYSESFTSFCLHSRTIKRSLNGANFSTIGCVLQCSYFIYSCSQPPPIHNEIHLSNCVPTPLPTYLSACLPVYGGSLRRLMLWTRFFANETMRIGVL